MKKYTSKQASFIEKVKKVFEIKNLPTVTYIPRRKAQSEETYEDCLYKAIWKGDLCLITGPSKTGKTCLFKNVVQQEKRKCLIIPCDRTLTSENIWTRTCEELDYERISTTSKSKTHKIGIEGCLEGKIGLNLLAFLKSKFTAKYGRDSTALTVINKILADPSYGLLLPAFKDLQCILVFDDFHKLKDSEASALLEQFKVLATAKVPVIATCNSHNIIDQLDGYSADLVGRLTQIKLNVWNEKDLLGILQKGFKHLKTPLPSDELCELITNRSVGLPMVVQAVALNLFMENMIGKTTKLFLDDKAVDNAFRTVVNENYSPYFEPYYDKLLRAHSTEVSRKAFQYIIYMLTINPSDYPLKLEDIYKEAENIQASGKGPSKRSLKACLKRINEVQVNQKIELLRWSQELETLEVLDPSFLFYLNCHLDLRGQIPDGPDGFLKLVLEARHDANDGTDQ